MFNVNLPLRTLQLILAIVALGLNSHGTPYQAPLSPATQRIKEKNNKKTNISLPPPVTSWYLHHTRPASTPHAPPYLIAVAILTLLTLPYLILNPVLAGGSKPNGRFFNKWAIVALDGLTCLLWFGGFVALAAFERTLILCGPCDVMIAGVVVGALAW